MSKFVKGDRVRFLKWADREGPGWTGITGTVTESNVFYEGCEVLLDRPAEFGVAEYRLLPTLEARDYELEYEDNRKNAITGELIASVGDIVYLREGCHASCQSDSRFFGIDKTYFKGDLWLVVRCPDCVDTLEIKPHEVENFCYLNEYPKSENHYGLSAV